MGDKSLPRSLAFGSLVVLCVIITGMNIYQLVQNVNDKQDFYREIIVIIALGVIAMAIIFQSKIGLIALFSMALVYTIIIWIEFIKDVEGRTIGNILKNSPLFVLIPTSLVFLDLAIGINLYYADR